MRRELEPMLRMATELGLDRFVPLRAERSLPDAGAPGGEISLPLSISLA
jgi:16S rRNA U1498 N3-methylase RsmE